MTQHAGMEGCHELCADDVTFTPTDMRFERADIAELQEHFGAYPQHGELVEETATIFRHVLDPDFPRTALPRPICARDMDQMAIFTTCLDGGPLFQCERNILMP